MQAKARREVQTATTASDDAKRCQQEPANRIAAK
jgi:hypothetical protein